MRRARIAPVLLTLLAGIALVLPGQAVAGPPEGVSGKMVFVDKTADGLRKYRVERNPANRLEWLTKLAPTRDPRVAVALGEATDEREGNVWLEAMILLSNHYVPRDDMSNFSRVRAWWAANKTDLRRRAKQLPQ